jgi:hypothetical protein
MQLSDNASIIERISLCMMYYACWTDQCTARRMGAEKYLDIVNEAFWALRFPYLNPPQT